MPDNPQERGAPDRNRISMEEPYEADRWAKKFGLTTEELAATIRKAGSNTVAAVEKELQKGKK